MTDDLSILGRLDPVPPGSTSGAARSAWGQATLTRIVAGEIHAPRRRRWPAVLAGVTGAAALAAVFVVLVIATGGGGPPVASLPVEVAALPAPGTPLTDTTLNETVVALGARATRLGIDGVQVSRSDDRITIALPADDLGRLDDLLAPGRMSVYSFDRSVVHRDGDPSRSAAESRAGPDDLVVVTPVFRADRTTTTPSGSLFFVLRGTPALTSADVADAQVVDPSRIGMHLTSRGQDAFESLTREAAQDGQLKGRPQSLAIVVDDVLVANPVIDYNQFPVGIDGRNGLDIEVGHRDAATLAAQIMSPLPLDLAREGSGSP